MSKFIEKLEKASRGESQPLGFGAAARRTKESPMLLIADLLTSDPQATREIAHDGADALINQTQATAGEEKPETGETPWGTRLEASQEKEAEHLQEIGCDFLIFASEGTPSSVLLIEELGKVLELELAFPDSWARAVDQLPIDAVLVSEPYSSLTINQLLAYQRLVNLVRRPLLLKVPTQLSEAELESLWNVGVRGLILEIRNIETIEELRELRKKIDALEPQIKKKRHPVEVTLPFSLGGTTPEEEEEEEEEEEDF
ncbi:MAG: hypothetical protein HY664_01145 [Chloroflexi bacterium]|nr:hypothetical protein [Chloroflexota bacterium]